MNDEVVLENKVKKFVRKKAYLMFLKGLKNISFKNYLLVRIYYFIMRSGYRNFLKRIILSKNEFNNKQLKNLSNIYNYSIHVKSFFRRFENRKKYLIANHNSLLFLTYNLKKKFFTMIKRYSHNSKVYKDKVSHLYTDYLKESVIKYLRKFYYNRYNRSIVRKFILTRAFKKLKEKMGRTSKPLSDTIVQSRLILTWRTFKNSLNNAKRINLAKKALYRSQLRFFFKMVYRKVKGYTKVVSGLMSHTRVLINNKIKLFFNKIKNSLGLKKLLFGKFICLSDKLTLMYKKVYFRSLYQDYIEAIENEYKLEKCFYERLFYKKLRLYINTKKRLHSGITAIRLDDSLKKRVYSSFFKSVQRSHELSNESRMADRFRTKQHYRNLFNLVRDSYYIYIAEKEKYIKALLNFRKNYIKKLFKALIANRLYQLNKKKEYEEVFNFRNRVIEENMMRLLISNCTREMKQKDDIITNLYVKRTTRGIKTVLKWYQILKNRIAMKKINKTTVKLETTIPVPLTQNKSEFEKDIDILLSLRNKKRERPKSININN
jgi:hypothetical protein